MKKASVFSKALSLVLIAGIACAFGTRASADNAASKAVYPTDIPGVVITEEVIRPDYGGELAVHELDDWYFVTQDALAVLLPKECAVVHEVINPYGGTTMATPVQNDGTGPVNYGPFAVSRTFTCNYYTLTGETACTARVNVSGVWDDVIGGTVTSVDVSFSGAAAPAMSYTYDISGGSATVTVSLGSQQSAAYHYSIGDGTVVEV